MPKKNSKKNGFYFYMKELQESQEARGTRITMASMPNYAHPKWKLLSVAEKEPYEDMARQFNKDPTLRGGKLASDGTRVEDNLREEEEKKQQQNRMIQNVKRCCGVDCGPKEQFMDAAPKKLFYFLSFNILCRTDEGMYIPIEVGLIEYSIQYGIHREYSKILNPGSPPTGYAGKAKQISDDGHQICIFGEENSERNVRLVYDEILQFTNPDGSGEYPPVFCLKPRMAATSGCLDWLAYVSRKENVFEVLDATVLLMELRYGLDCGFPTYSIAYDLLDKASFNYHPSTRCEFHEEKDLHFCALSYVKRVCYLLSDAVCNLFNVQLTEKHIPTRSVEEKSYRVTVFKEESSRDDFAHDNPVRLDKTRSYYQNAESHEQNEARAPEAQPRQPATLCLTETMNRLRLERAAATVPGHGIGRGTRRN